jgi:UPF0755 protein
LTSDLPPRANDNDDRAPGGVRREPHLLPRSPAEALEPMRPPEPPEREPDDRRMNPFLAFLNGMVTLCFATALLAIGLFYFLRVQFDQPGPLPVSTVVVIPKGEGTNAIAERLEREGVISDRGMFVTSILYFKYFKGTGNLKAGEYEFRKNASLRQVLDTLVEGKSIGHKVTIAEGLTSQQIVERLNANTELVGDITEIPAEGSLLPDTYRFQTGDTRLDIIERMRAGQQKFLAKMWEERDPDIVVKTPEEAVTLASIVEKETGRADERPRIASVFENRLRKRMRLQSDPTIIYGLVGGKGMLDHPIQQDELERDTEYNTYKIDGLPPGPIANPGRAALEAVLKPAKTKDLYFVADGKGGHVFAPSLEEHNKNVAKWRVVEREIREREAEEAAAAAKAGTPEAAGAATAVPTDQPTGTAPQVAANPEAAATPGVKQPLAIIRDTPAEPAQSNAPAPPLPRRNPNR